MQFIWYSIIAAATLACAGPVRSRNDNRKCRIDDCINSVTGSDLLDPPVNIRRHQCRNFMAGNDTVIPDPITAYVTIFPTITAPGPVDTSVVDVPDATEVVPNETIVPEVTALIPDVTSFIPEATALVPNAPVPAVGAPEGILRRQEFGPSDPFEGFPVNDDGFPAFASACNGLDDYRRACSCWGYQTTTLAPVVNTVTVTAAPVYVTGPVTVDQVTDPYTVTDDVPVTELPVTVSVDDPLTEVAPTDVVPGVVPAQATDILPLPH